jgi:hypothetical protein
MASGDHARAWWPRMLEELPRRWNSALDWSECISLCHDMTKLRDEIRTENNVEPPLVQCRWCGGVSYLLPAPVSVRSLLFALRKIGQIDLVEFNTLDGNWKRYQKLHALDAYGEQRKVKASPGCNHPVEAKAR